jgi:hypothetical protein
MIWVALLWGCEPVQQVATNQWPICLRHQATFNFNLKNNIEVHFMTSHKGQERAHPPQYTDTQRREQSWDVAWDFLQKVPKAVFLYYLSTATGGHISRIQAGHCEEDKAIRDIIAGGRLALKRCVAVTSIYHQMCTSYYMAITAGWCIQPTPMLVVDSEKPEKEQVSLRDWEGVNSPGPHSFKVTWDKNPGQEPCDETQGAGEACSGEDRKLSYLRKPCIVLTGRESQ